MSDTTNWDDQPEDIGKVLQYISDHPNAKIRDARSEIDDHAYATVDVTLYVVHGDDDDC